MADLPVLAAAGLDAPRLVDDGGTGAMSDTKKFRVAIERQPGSRWRPWVYTITTDMPHGAPFVWRNGRATSREAARNKAIRSMEILFGVAREESLVVFEGEDRSTRYSPPDPAVEARHL